MFFFAHLQLLSRRNALHERAQSRRAALEDSFHLQQFFRDSDELKSWINEKMKTATDEAYKVAVKDIDKFSETSLLKMCS